MYRTAAFHSVVYCGLAMWSPAIATAELITFYFSGEITSVDPVLAAEFSIGDPFSGSYSFESTTPQLDEPPIYDPGPNQGYYSGMQELTAKVGSSYDIALGEQGLIFVDNLGSSYGSGPSDGMKVVFTRPTSQSVAGRELTAFSINLRDQDGDIFDSDDLPLAPPPISEIERSRTRLRFSDDAQNFHDVEMRLDHFSLTKIPEPATVLQGIAAVFTLAMCRRRQIK